MYGDAVSIYEGQTVFNPFGSQLFEKLDENYFPFNDFLSIKHPYVAPKLCNKKRVPK